MDKIIIGDDFSLWADEGKLLQIINNLFSNAVKYTPEKGSINLEISREEDFMKLMVQNTGAYIPETELESIFDRYKRLDTTQDGSGLGLAVTKDIVKRAISAFLKRSLFMSSLFH